MKIYKIIFRIFLLFIFAVGLCNSQIKNEKIYLNSENNFVTVLSYTYWSAVDTSDYFGKFVFVNPAEDDQGNPNGDGWTDNLFLNYIPALENDAGFNVFAYTMGKVEGLNEPMIDTMRNSRIECEGEMLISSSCSFISDAHSGDFVILKYKTIKGTTKDTKGILITRNDNKDYKYFYEKTLDGSSK